jgi:hypothetical protein
MMPTEESFEYRGSREGGAVLSKKQNGSASPIGIDTTFEKHYSLTELGELWGLSYSALRRAFEHEPDIVRLNSKGKRPGTRRHETIRVPESVARRVRSRLLQGQGR